MLEHLYVLHKTLNEGRENQEMEELNLRDFFSVPKVPRRRAAHRGGDSGLCASKHAKTRCFKQKVDVGRGWTSICHQKPSRTGEIMCILCITGNAGQHHLKKISVIDIN